jgi:TolA-binding protein
MAVLRTLAGAVLLFFSSALAAQSLGTVLAADIKKMQANEASQKRVESIVSETDKLENQYRQVTKETDGLNVYIELLQSRVDAQQREINNLDGATDKIAVIQRQIVPQMKKMIDALESFISLDMPFLQEERTNRIARLNGLLERSDVSVAEQFRSVVEAYKIESGFGHSIESYKGKVNDSGTERDVDFLRVGRIGLYWQTGDASITKAWNQKTGEWIELGDEYRNAVRTGLQIADEKRAPELLLLPVPAPEAS